MNPDSEFDKSFDKLKTNYKEELDDFIAQSKKEETEAKERIRIELEKKIPFQDDVMEKFRVSRQWKIFFIILSLITLLTIIVYLLIPKKVELRVVNLNPYKARFAVSYFDNDSIVITKGWYSLKPGEERIVELSIPKWMDEEIFYYAESDNYDAIKWVSGGIHDYVSFSYSHDELEYRFVSIDKNFDVLSKITTGEYGDEKVLELVKNSSDSTFYDLLPFVKINSFSSSGLFGLDFEVRKELRGAKYESVFKDNEKKRIVWCKEFSASIQRNLKYINVFPDLKDDPFHPGFNPSDTNVIHKEGLIIKNPAHYNLFGEPFSLLENDILLSFNGKQLFNYGDLLWYLSEYASSKDFGGIMNSIDYTVLREGKIMVLKESFFFNPLHYEDASFDATILGFSSAILWHQKWAIHGANYLFKSSLNFLFDLDLPIEERWDFYQRYYRLKQFFPEEFENGSTLGLFAPSPFVVLSASRIAKAFKGGSKLTNKIIKTGTYIAIETFADMAIYNNSASMLRPKEMINQNYDDEFKFSLGTNVILGIFMSR